jgi:hypothetical protein
LRPPLCGHLVSNALTQNLTYFFIADSNSLIWQNQEEANEANIRLILLQNKGLLMTSPLRPVEMCFLIPSGTTHQSRRKNDKIYGNADKQTKSHHSAYLVCTQDATACFETTQSCVRVEFVCLFAPNRDLFFIRARLGGFHPRAAGTGDPRKQPRRRDVIVLLRLVVHNTHVAPHTNMPPAHTPCMPPASTHTHEMLPRIDRRVHSTRRGRGMDLPEKRGST